MKHYEATITAKPEYATNVTEHDIAFLSGTFTFKIGDKATHFNGLKRPADPVTPEMVVTTTIKDLSLGGYVTYEIKEVEATP